MIAVPYHLDQRLERFDLGVAPDVEVTAPLLPSAGPWQRMAMLYEQVAEVVAQATRPPVIVSGDCTTSLGVLAGLQRARRDLAIVWLDAHADFHTEATTTSGYLGGLPLALAVGLGTLTLPEALGLRPVPQSRVLLVDARDTDPGEQVLLDQSVVTRVPLQDLTDDVLPVGDLYLHIDLDVADPQDVPDLLYPAHDGPALTDVLAVVQRVMTTRRVAAVGLAVTWRWESEATAAHRDVLRRLVQAVT